MDGPGRGMLRGKVNSRVYRVRGRAIMSQKCKLLSIHIGREGETIDSKNGMSMQIVERVGQKQLEQTNSHRNFSQQ